MDRFRMGEDIEFDETAYEKGRNARLVSNFDLRHNEYESGTWLALSWAAGWTDADMDILQAKVNNNA